MTIKKIELRFNQMDLESNGEGLKVSGYVNKTNQWSETLGLRKKFVERILPGTFTRALQNGNEIHFLAEHDKEKILSSTRNGSLTLREDDNGLFMEAEIAPTSWGRDYHTLINEGIIKNMSFGMRVVKDSWKKLTDGTYERSITDLDLFEVSAVRNPAYVQSTIQAKRSVEVIEDVEVPENVDTQKEKRELSLEEELNIKRQSLKNYKKLATFDKTDVQLKEKITKIEGEIRQMESKIVQTDGAEKRAVTSTGEPSTGPITRKIDIVKNKVKKLGGKSSLVARTHILVTKQTEIDMFSEHGEFLKENMFVEELEDIPLKDFDGDKIKIKGKRAGYGIEVSQLLEHMNDMELSDRFENRLISRIDDGLNFSMLNEAGSMENINTSELSHSITSQDVGTISLVDVLTLISKLNQEYRNGAEFIMHTDVFNGILTNTEFLEHLEFVVDEVTGKKLYHLLGYPIVVNDNALASRILFTNLGEGYTTLISEDSFNTKIINNDTESARKKSQKHILDIYGGGAITNKDCFVRLDVKTA